MVCVAGKGQGIFEIWDLPAGGDEPEKKTLEVAQNITVAKLIRRVLSLCNREIENFGLILTWGRKKVDLMYVSRNRTIADLGVDFASGTVYTLLVTECQPLPPVTGESAQFFPELLGGTLPERASPRTSVMLLVDGAAESPINDSETKISTPTDDDTTGDKIPATEKLDFNVWKKNVVKGENAPSWKLRRTDKDNERIEMQGNEEGEPNRRSETSYVGLVNQAMTCYLNSLLQALYMTPEFRNALYNWEYVHSSEKDEACSIPYQLQKLFLNLQTSSKTAIETTSLTKSFGWDSTQAWQQHDIQELCRVMFDALEQKFKNTAQADLINRLYEGKMMDYVTCLECGTEKLREDTFLDIPLPVRPFGSNVAYNSVEEALGAFVQPETLDGTNQYHCETCNKKCDAHKGLKFTKFPYFLTLHLKRFDFDYNTFHRIKLNDEVTFPDILNLNSFIPSTSADTTSRKDSTCNEEVGKCDDSSTTDSANLDDECTRCNNGMSVNENSTNDTHEDEKEEDESIERSNVASTSNCNSHNHDSEKNRENCAGPRGPYEYELFSIMIHSGSASGGHYYAYIKDFRTGEWLCFNDQNVSTITYDDIQKTYGGGPARAYYSGVYSSSTNAYMLMYRQIDPERNALPMQVVDFPKHLQELLIKMQDTEYNVMKNRNMLMQMYRLKVYCNHPNEKTMVDKKMLCLHDETWGELTERAYRALGLENIIERDCVRLVTYQPSNGLIDCSFDGYEHEPLSSLFDDQADLLLEIRKDDETFQTYLPGGIATRVYVLDIANKVVTKVVNLRCFLKQTVQEYKEKLSCEIGLEGKSINLIIQYPINSARLVTKNGNTLKAEGFSSANKIFVPTSFGDDTKKSIEDCMNRITNIIQNLISLNIELPDLSEEALREQNIPTLEEKKKERTNETPVTNGPTKLSSTLETTREIEKTEVNEITTKPNVTEELSTVRNKTASPLTIQTDVEDWNTPEQSNSEDSSLSYSDRTLVGEGDASEDDDYPLANVDPELFNQTNQENNQVKDPTEDFFSATRDDYGADKFLRILVNKRMNLGTLKKLLEPHIGVPMEYLRVFSQPARDMECTRLSMEMTLLDDGAMLRIKLGLALRPDEYKVRLHQLVFDSETEPFKYLCEWVISREAMVGQTKKEILAELKRKFSIDIPHERCRLRRMNKRTAANAFLDDKKFDDVRFGWARDILIQELPDKETITDQDDVLIFVRRMPLPDADPGPIQEIAVSGKSLVEIREKLSEISGIPEEYLEMAEGSNYFPDDIMLRVLQDRDWKRSLLVVDDNMSYTFEDGIFIYYRDSRQKPHELSAEELEDIMARRKVRMYGVSARSRYSPRRERALKIYVDDK